MNVDVSAARAWALENVGRFKPNPCGPNRRFLIFDDWYPQEVEVIRQQIVKAFDLHGAITEPMYKDFCGFITDGGFVHRHIDPNQGDLIHTRFNVLVSKPDVGGVAVINDVEVHVEEGGVWRCDAGRYYHSTTPVVGDKPRIVLSFGFLL